MTVDLSTVPLVALSVETKQVISTLLNPPKIIPCENGLPRDWKGLAHLFDVSGELMPLLTSHPDPTSYILTVWEQRNKNITIKDFQTVLEKIDRWDVFDDTVALVEKDAEKYVERLQKSQASAEPIENEIDEKVLTVDDLHRLRQGLENQYYDAFLLYADEDTKFASEMVEKLENQYNLKLCLKDRDLIGGVTFEHEAVMTLISERCNRLIVIVSSNFLKSPANKFFLNYAQALGIDKRQRKVIPCLYEKCQLPPQLSYMFILDYNRVGLYDFWGKLRDSVRTLNGIKQDAKSITLEKQNAMMLENKNLDENIKANKFEDNNTKENYLQPYKISDTKLNNTDHNKLEDIAKSKDSDDLRYREEGKKVNNLLQWTKKKLNRKSENSKKEYEPITETVTISDLPSLDGLDTLSTSTESVEKKQKTKFMDKCMKKVQLKKILVKS